MSLRTFLERPDLRARFNQEFQPPILKCTDKMKVERRINKTMAGRLGTAFHYLLDFWMETLNPNVETDIWAAESAPLSMHRFEVKERKRVEQLLKDAKICHANYLKTGEMNDEIISTVVTLAQLENIDRQGTIDPDLGEIETSMIEELRDMIKLAKRELFTAKAYCALNPKFGNAPMLVNGANADLIIDDTLIDIKTTVERTIKREYVNQIIGYYVLSELGEINHKIIKINKLGIYSARYGELLTFPTEQIVGKGFPQFLEWFRNTADKPFVPTCETCQDRGKKPCPNLEVFHPPLSYNRKNASPDNKCDVCNGLTWITCPDCLGGSTFQPLKFTPRTGILPDPYVLYLKNELKQYGNLPRNEKIIHEANARNQIDTQISTIELGMYHNEEKLLYVRAKSPFDKDDVSSLTKPINNFMRCPKCGSEKLIKAGFKRGQQVYECKNCYHTTTKPENNRSQKDYQEYKAKVCDTCHDERKLLCPNAKHASPRIRCENGNVHGLLSDYECNVCNGKGWISCPDCTDKSAG